jgi:hypothetical protein
VHSLISVDIVFYDKQRSVHCIRFILLNESLEVEDFSIKSHLFQEIFLFLPCHKNKILALHSIYSYATASKQALSIFMHSHFVLHIHI